MIDRYVKKALQLIRMQVYRQYSAGSGGRYKISHQFCCNGYTSFIFPVLSGIAEIWNNHSNTAGAGPSQTV